MLSRPWVRPRSIVMIKPAPGIEPRSERYKLPVLSLCTIPARTTPERRKRLHTRLEEGISRNGEVVGDDGIEPSLTVSEAVVLPLDESPSTLRRPDLNRDSWFQGPAS